MTYYYIRYQKNAKLIYTFLLGLDWTVLSVIVNIINIKIGRKLFGTYEGLDALQDKVAGDVS